MWDMRRMTRLSSRARNVRSCMKVLGLAPAVPAPRRRLATATERSLSHADRDERQLSGQRPRET